MAIPMNRFTVAGRTSVTGSGGAEREHDGDQRGKGDDPPKEDQRPRRGEQQQVQERRRDQSHARGAKDIFRRLCVAIGAGARRGEDGDVEEPLDSRDSAVL